jgi:hypothetical protein
MNNRIMFLRDASGMPCGCLAINLDRKNRKLKYQYSVLNPADYFDRKTARVLALGRLLDSPVSVPLSRTKEVSMHEVSSTVMNHLVASSAPSRAVKAAKLWLETKYSTEEDE